MAIAARHDRAGNGIVRYVEPPLKPEQVRPYNVIFWLRPLHVPLLDDEPFTIEQATEALDKAVRTASVLPFFETRYRRNFKLLDCHVHGIRAYLRGHPVELQDNEYHVHGWVIPTDLAAWINRV